jgi:hypothetical protein
MIYFTTDDEPNVTFTTTGEKTIVYKTDFEVSPGEEYLLNIVYNTNIWTLEYATFGGTESLTNEEIDEIWDSVMAELYDESDDIPEDSDDDIQG